MSESGKFKIIYEGNVSEFEKQILYNSDQEVIKGKPGGWCQLADVYARQLAIISHNPYPEELDGGKSMDDETPPSVKHIYKNTIYGNLYRWGIQGGWTGNHRIIYTIHNYHKVIMLYYFDKQYNGLIKRRDIVPAELTYEKYCALDPNLY